MVTNDISYVWEVQNIHVSSPSAGRKIENDRYFDYDVRIELSVLCCPLDAICFFFCLYW